MKIVDIEEARIHLSELVDEAVDGHPFIIAIDGKPMVRVEAIDPLDTSITFD